MLFGVWIERLRLAVWAWAGWDGGVPESSFYFQTHYRLLYLTVPSGLIEG